MGDQEDRKAEFALQARQQPQDLRLHGNVERGGRLVGDQQFGIAHQRHRDHDALTQAAGKLMRKLAEPHLRRGDTDAAHQFDRPLERGGARAALVAGQHLSHLRADRKGRVEAGHRLLEDHRDPVAAQARHLAVGQRKEVGAGKAHAFGGAPAAAREQVHDRQRGHRFAAAGFADQAMRLALLDLKRGAAYRRATAAEHHFEILDVKQCAHRDRSEPSRLRNPSPTRLMPSTRMNSATPGTMITQAEKNM
jgi:hypothetical protein